MTDTITKMSHHILSSIRFGRYESRIVLNDTTTRDDLLRLADDGCPNLPNGAMDFHDLLVCGREAQDGAWNS